MLLNGGKGGGVFVKLGVPTKCPPLPLNHCISKWNDIFQTLAVPEIWTLCRFFFLRFPFHAFSLCDPENYYLLALFFLFAFPYDPSSPPSPKTSVNLIFCPQLIILVNNEGDRVPREYNPLPKCVASQCPPFLVLIVKGFMERDLLVTMTSSTRKWMRVYWYGS